MSSSSRTPRFADHASHVHAVVQAAIAAASPARCVSEQAPSDLRGRACRLIAAGKASLAMTSALLLDVGARVTQGVVIGPGDPAGTRHDLVATSLARAIGIDRLNAASIEAFDADHPLPTPRNLLAARRAAELARQSSVDRTPLVLLLSGGASAHLALPADPITLDNLVALTRALLRAGATITQLNTVRKHVEQLKAGGLARLAAPASIDALILSDVVGDDLRVIASGPVTPDDTTPDDALDILRTFALDVTFPAITSHLACRATLAATSAPQRPSTPNFPHVRTTIVGNNTIALDAAAAAIRTLGFDLLQIDRNVQGEARVVGQRLAAQLASLSPRDPCSPHAFLLGGETTVHVRGNGIGGRNQELALAAAIVLASTPASVVASFGTDGIDGPTDAAGAWAASGPAGTLSRARASGINAIQALDHNDSYSLFDAAGSLIRTGPTGTNVCDIAFALRYPSLADLQRPVAR